jgi:hypothetical protein
VGVPLDRRSPRVAGAAQRAPHALLQELLNRTDTYLWGLISNGRLLRLLRDSTSLTGQAYIEFDLESMFDGDLYADYAQLYLLVHQSRVEVADGAQPADCWLERWRTTAISQGVRALDLLRSGVQEAMQTLGTGFLQHPANGHLRSRLAATCDLMISTRACCARSTGFCSGRWLRIGRPSSIRTVIQPRPAAIIGTSPLPGCANSHDAAMARPTTICGMPLRWCWRRCPAPTASRVWDCPV